MLRAVRARLLAAIGRRLARPAPGRDAAQALFAAHALVDRGDVAAAGRAIEGLTSTATEADIEFLRGRLALRQADEAAALTHLENVARLQPRHVAALVQLAKLYTQRRDGRRARECYEAALETAPDVPELHARLGAVHLEGARFAAAQTCLERALELNPGLSAARNDLGRVHRERGDLDLAIRCFEDTLARDPASRVARLNLAMALNAVGAHEEALAQFESFLASDARNAVALCGAGDASYELGGFAEAGRYFRETLAVDPDNAGAHFGLANIQLVHGEMDAGWAGYEWRKRLVRYAANYESAAPCARGEDLRGRSVVVTAEQGFGDVLLFARFLPRLATRAGTIVFRCYPELARLMQASLGPAGVNVVPLREPVAAEVAIPLLSLGHVLGVTAEDIDGATPYLCAPAALCESWRAKVARDGRLKVGLAWGANPRRAYQRSRVPAAADYAALAGVGNVEFYNLRIGADAGEIARFPLPLTDLTGAITDFADTAALVDALDLVISIDTSVAHLCGAMGKPVWVLHAGVPDWRWAIAARESPWYAGGRLYRRDEAGWARTLSQVAQALRAAG